MGQQTNIEWCHHTFNPWIGCTKVSAGCANCYAEALMDKRWGKVQWGPNGTRNRTGESNWREPLKWDREAAKAGERRRVFCASLADVFEDREELMPWRRDLFDIIYRTKNLDWLLLTKRPENVCRMLGPDGVGLYAHADGPVPCPQPNVWLGTSVEDQKAADERIPHLLKCPAAIRFLSVEPLLGMVDLEARKLLSFPEPCVRHVLEQPASAERTAAYDKAMYECPLYYDGCNCPGIGWVIVGGESGPGARPLNIEWVRSIVSQCKSAGVPCFVKQLGAKPGFTLEDEQRRGNVAPSYHHFDESSRLFIKAMDDPKGGDPSEWPEDLCVREWPEPVAAREA